MLREQLGKETVLHEIDRGEIRRNRSPNATKQPMLPAHLPPLVNGWLMPLMEAGIVPDDTERLRP
jgi:hypothetical protein